MPNLYIPKELGSMAMNSGGSRISRWGGADPLGGGANLQRVHFSVKTKEIDPVGGARAGSAPLDPPMMKDNHWQIQAASSPQTEPNSFVFAS